MLEKLDGPDSVLVFEAVGKLLREDYEKVLEPAVRDMIARQGEVRFVYVLGNEYEGYSLGAGWEDVKTGLGDSSKWTRCAVVTNHEWIRHGVSMFGWMMPGQTKLFEPSDLEAAIAWAAG
jgi:SpoIIAA-like